MTAFLPPPYDGLTTTQEVGLIGLVVVLVGLFLILVWTVKR